MSTAPPDQRDDTLFALLDLIRAGEGRTRPELVRHTGLGRKLVTQRVERLIELGLVGDGDLGRSTGGRAPRELFFRADGGHLLVAELGATSISLGITDLVGRLLHEHQEPAEVVNQPDRTLDRVEQLFDELLGRRPAGSPPVWGVGVGVLGPVDVTTGRPLALPVMRRWADYPVRDRLAARYDVPVWVDNEVNLMALGELRGGLGRGVRDFVFVKVGTGIAAGLVSGGELLRGAHGMAGEIGHLVVVEDDDALCWCGNTGCLVQHASGLGLATFGRAAAEEGRSPVLARLLAAGHDVTAADVAAAAATGDPASVAMLTRAGQLIGRALASLASTLNPSLILVGGGLAGAGDILLAAIRQSVYQRTFPIATRDLQVAFSPLSDRAGLVGASFMVSDELLSQKRLGRWIAHGTPAGRAALVHEDPAA
jgi:glucokinase-like ROK family protein